jgi:hypothetical protein
MSERRTKIPAKQLGGVESPATVILTPMHFSPGAAWWSYDQVLLGGIKVNGAPQIPAGGLHCLIGYMPIPIPRSWGEDDFHVVVEYEADAPSARFKFRICYGCGDPSELRLGETDTLVGDSGGKRRLKFKLNEAYLARNELFRASLDVVRESPDPVLVYGTWLEVGV